MPRSTCPSPTKVGMSAAGRKMRAMSRFLTRAMSSRFSLRNWISAPSRRLSVACCRRPSGRQCQRSGAQRWWLAVRVGSILLGTAKSSRPSRLCADVSGFSIGCVWPTPQLGAAASGRLERNVLVYQIHIGSSVRENSCIVVTEIGSRRSCTTSEQRSSGSG